MDEQTKILIEIRDLLKKLVPQNEIAQLPALSYHEEFNELKELLHSNSWPFAVDPDMIVDENSETDCESRAQGLMDFLIDEPLENKRFLDFGCGSGYFAKYAKDVGAFWSAGYDVQRHRFWDGIDLEGKGELTTDWLSVVRKGPYDHIMLYDVIDHVGSEVKDVLKKIRSVSHTETKIYIRCHPWTSRTASHLYRRINKAFMHMVFSDIELTRLGYTPDTETIHIIHPQIAYEKWFAETGFRILDKNIVTEHLEDFFENNEIIAKRIKAHWSDSHEPDLRNGSKFPSHQLKLQFLDYVLATS